MTTEKQKRLKQAAAAAERTRADKARRLEERARRWPTPAEAAAEKDQLRKIRAKRKADADAARAELASLRTAVDNLVKAIGFRAQEMIGMHQDQARDEDRLEELKTQIARLRARM
jgi:cupin superfamily acireductone dioxygenase involved in methionine salvage